MIEFITSRLLNLRGKGSRKYTVCHYTDDKCILVVVDKIAENDFLLQDFIVPINDLLIARAGLLNFIGKKKLYGMPCAWFLTPEDYQLSLIERHGLLLSDMKKSLQWTVNEIFNQPPDSVMSDLLEVPPPEGMEMSSMIYVIGVNKKNLLFRNNWLQSVNLKLKNIDLGIMAIRNVCVHHPVVNEGLLHVMLWQDSVMLTVIHDQCLYLSRKITVNLQENKEQEQLDNQCNEVVESGAIHQEITLDSLNVLSQEIQRSIDYCEMNLGLPAPKHILLDGFFNFSTISDIIIGNGIILPIHELVMSDLFPWINKLSPEIRNNTFIIGSIVKNMS